jgi:Cu(I)/Ag(I) efflux system membrane fusion protein
MFVDLEFSIQAPPGLSVSEEAVLDSGLQKIVYVQTAKDLFEPRPVEIGTVYGNRATVTRGLAAGDRVVTSSREALTDSRVAIGGADETQTRDLPRDSCCRTILLPSATACYRVDSLRP